jgi:lipopolysaccharide transport system permease protein
MPKPTQESVYGPRSELRHPVGFLRAMARDALDARELAWRLFLRNVSAKYRQTLIGYAWAFLPPIATTLTFVFLNAQQIVSVGEMNLPYPLYVMTGTILWQVFLDALNSPMAILAANKAMLTKVNFPREALVMAGLAEVLFGFAIRLVLLATLFAWFRVSVPWTVVFAPLGLISLLALGTTLGVFLAPVSLLFEDVRHGLTVLTGLWFFLTPVVYAVPTEPPASWVASFNPVSPLLITTRTWLTEGPSPGLQPFLVVAGLTLVFSFAAWAVYRLAFPHVIARIGS